jgi:hypothetical protein
MEPAPVYKKTFVGLHKGRDQDRYLGCGEQRTAVNLSGTNHFDQILPSDSTLCQSSLCGGSGRMVGTGSARVAEFLMIDVIPKADN